MNAVLGINSSQCGQAKRLGIEIKIVKLPLFANDIVVVTGNLKESTKTLLEQ